MEPNRPLVRQTGVQTAARYTGLTDLGRLQWAVARLTGDADAAALPAEHVADRALGSGRRAVLAVRSARRREHLRRLVGLGSARPRVAEPTVGRQRLADAFDRLPHLARAMVVFVDGCGMPAGDVAAALGVPSWWGRRALERGRRRLRSALALPPLPGVDVDPFLGPALRALRAPAETAAVLAPAYGTLAPWGSRSAA